MKKKVCTIAAALLLLGGVNRAEAQTGAALNFDGNNDYVDLGSSITSAYNNGTHATVEAWVYPTSTVGTNAIVGNHQGPTQFQLRRNASNYEFFIGFGSFGVISTASVNVNTWQHVAGVFNGTSLSIYVDGVLSGTTAVTSFSFPTSTVNMKIGDDGFSEYFIGSIDEVRFWTTARTQVQIQANMNCAVTDTATGLLAYYSFNDGIANGTNTGINTIHDIAGNKFDGILNNFTLSSTISNFVNDKTSDYLGLQSTVGSTDCNNTLGGGVAEDFTGDGAKDVIVIDWSSATRLYVNDGKGNFSNTYLTISPTGGNYDAADIDNDGDMDFVTAAGSTVKVYINDGAGNFTIIPTNLFMGTGTGNVAKFADVTGDGMKDVIIGNGGSGTTDSSQIWKNTGTIGNASFAYYRGLAPSPARNSIAVGDINGDGFIDIVTGGNSWAAQVFHNNSNNSTFTQVASPAGYGGGVKLIDWNQDGKLDYMNYDNYNTYGLRYILNDGSGIFLGTPTLLLQSSTSGVCNLADLNGDGFLDAVLNSWGGNGIVYLSNGCTLTTQSACNYTLGKADNNVTLADFNGDGATDIFCQARCNFSSFYMNYLNPVTNPPIPSISVSGTTTICAGATTTLTATGNATSYSWTAGPTTAAYAVTPTVNTTYSVVGTNSVGCSSNTATATINVNSLPTLTVTVNTATICAGTMDTLSVSGTATSYIWNTTETTMSITPTPSMTTTYTVTGTDANACVNTATTTINVNSLPTLTVTVNTATICAGTMDTINVSGTATSYIWNTTETTMSVTPTPSMTTTYTVTGTDVNGCMNMATASINVNALPVITISDASICAGGSFTISPSGVTSFTVSGGSSVITPTGTASYSITGTDANGCVTATDAVMTVTVNILPTLTVTPNDTTICPGASVTLNANGATSYTWSTTETTGSIVATPTANATYSVSGTDANGCTGMSSTSVTVTVCTGIAKYSNNINVSVYPNPSKGEFTIASANYAENTTLTIYNAIGQAVYTTKLNSALQTINANLANGMYVIRLQNAQGTGTQHIIITE